MNMDKIVIDDGLLWCRHCNDYTFHWHYLSEFDHYCYKCGKMR
jgi:hypothetical protein